jgi:hypothetical protein
MVYPASEITPFDELRPHAERPKRVENENQQCTCLGTKVVWLLFKKKDLTVSTHTQSYKSTSSFGDELLDDGGIGLNLSAKEVLGADPYKNSNVHSP